MAEYLVIESAHAMAGGSVQTLAAGQLLNDRWWDISLLTCQGVPLVGYDPATMEGPRQAFFKQSGKPGKEGDLVALLLAAGALPGQVQNNPVGDYWLRVAKGEIEGHRLVVVSGHITGLASSVGVFTDVNEFGDLSYLAAAERMDITSGDAQDTLAGTGAQRVFVSGVDNDGVEISETVEMNGPPGVLTSKAYLRVNSLVVVQVGSQGWNAGTIQAEAETAGTTQAQMTPELSVSRGAAYTVPAGKTLFVLKFELNATKVAGGQNPQIVIRNYARPGGAPAPWLQFFDRRFDTNVGDGREFDLPIPEPGIEQSDIRLRATTDQDSTEIRSRLSGVLVDNPA